MIISDSLKWRYATKEFDASKKVSKTQINTLKDAFQLTATSYGLQPIHLLIIENNDLKEKIFKHSYFQKQVLSCSHLLIICIEDHYKQAIIDRKFELESKIRGTNIELLNTFKESLLKTFKALSDSEINDSYVNQAYIALGNLLTVCAIEKIDCCPMEGFNAKEIDSILDLKSEHLKSKLLLPIGFRSKDDFMATLKKVRRPQSEIIKEYN